MKQTKCRFEGRVEEVRRQKEPGKKGPICEKRRSAWEDSLYGLLKKEKKGGEHAPMGDDTQENKTKKLRPSISQKG